MFSGALMLLLAAGSCVNSLDLIQPDSMVVQPGQSLTISCQVSGYSLTDDSYATGWIRQSEGKPMDWISHQWGGGDFYQNDALKNKFSYSRDTSARTVTLKGQNVQPEDTAVYYCVRQLMGWGCYAFDYWGKGTEVTVSSATAAAPTLFPLVECESKTPDKITVGCLAQDFYPKSLTFQWIAASGTILTPTQYPPTERNNKYTGVSLVEVSKSDWKSRKSFTCTVTYQGGTKRVILETKAPSPTTVAALIITAQKPPRDKDTIIQSNSKSDVTEPKVSVHVLPEEDIRTQKPPRAKDDLSDHDVTEPKVTVHVLPDGNEPKVSVHVLPEEDVRTADSVTLVCLVSSREKQDYKIAWIEYSGQNVSNYKDGIDFPPQMTNQGFSATSIYNTTKEKWNNDDMFSCNVWLAGSGREPTKSRNVSNAQNNMNECKK